VIAELQEKQADIARLCEEYGVIRLGVFGSAARGIDFKPESSDIDFLALFDGRDRVDYIDRYFDLADQLEALFNRKVDLVTEFAVRSPRFRAEIDRDLEPIYARSARESAA
jgi:predicted nucleotidyltransferase